MWPLLPFIPGAGALLSGAAGLVAGAFVKPQAASLLTPGLLSWGLKAIRRFIDGALREKVRPVPGSVVYCDLAAFVEHSGIYWQDGQIVNIVVDGVAESEVRLSDAADFTAKSLAGHIYVSCDADGAVGHPKVAAAALARLGERAFYGLVIANCHEFSAACLRAAPERRVDKSLAEGLAAALEGPIDPSFAALKLAARKHLGATKWKLWEWQSDDAEEVPPEEPDWRAIDRFYRHLPLTPETLPLLRAELADARAYQEELADEPLPEAVRRRLAGFVDVLEEIDAVARRAASLIEACPGAGFTLAGLKALDEDFAQLAAQLRHNPRIQALVKKLGREHVSPAQKRRARVPRMSRNETHGVHLSDDLARLLPVELVKLEDETLETLFYAQLAEKRLLAYELKGITHVEEDKEERRQLRTGPVVACLDTSGSMAGLPLIKAKALLLAVANMLREEGRKLHVLLFGAKGELAEYALDDAAGIPGLLQFMHQGFGGGTDFETPLARALSIIEQERDYRRADILMISDGEAIVSPEFAARFVRRKEALECSVYSVRVAGGGGLEGFSDEMEHL